MESLIHQSFSIQFVANITGINPHTIRAWEKRYQAIIPNRDLNGRRLYSQEDIDRLNLLNELVRSGNCISDIAHLASNDLSLIHRKFITDAPRMAHKNSHLDLHNILQNLHMAIEFFKLDILEHEMAKAVQILSPVEFSLNILHPLFNIIKQKITHKQFNANQVELIARTINSHIQHKISLSNNNNQDLPIIAFATTGGSWQESQTLKHALLACGKRFQIKNYGSFADLNNVFQFEKHINLAGLFLFISDEDKDKLTYPLQQKMQTARYQCIYWCNQPIEALNLNYIGHGRDFKQKLEALSESFA